MVTTFQMVFIIMGFLSLLLSNGVNGRNPESLVDYVCNEKGWSYEIPEPDLEMDL